MLEKINVENLIYEIRSKQVMLDSDLAKLYGCTNGTKDIDKFNKQYKNLKIKYYYNQCKLCFCILKKSIMR